MHDADPPLREAGLAVGEVYPPHPPKALVVAEILKVRGRGLEVGAPASQGLGVVRRQVLESDGSHVGVLSDAARDHGERGQAAAREDVGANEAPRGLLDLVGSIVDNYRLKQHRPIIDKKVRAARKERVEIAVPDGLDHLDRDELLVAFAQVAIILAQHRDSIGDPGRPHPLAGMLVLLVRDRGGRDPATPRSRGVDSETAPSRADLQDVIAGPQIELVTHQLELCSRSLRECHPLAREVRGRVHHRLVEHQREQLVPEVVVGRDAAATARVCVACAETPRGLQRNPCRREPATPLVKAPRVARSHAHNGRQIRGLPQPLHIGLGHPAAAVQQSRPQVWRANLHRRLRAAVTQHQPALALDNSQLARAQTRQQAKRDPSRDALRHRHACSSGRACNGTPLSFSASECP